MSDDSQRDVDQHAIVTGGAGFIGSHLVDSLLRDGSRVTVLDNLSSGRSDNLTHHASDDRVIVVQHDIREPIPSLESVDVIYHFASRASPADFVEHAVEIAETNSIGTRNVFDLARTHDASVLLASTSEVYGDPEVHPQSEEYHGHVNPRGPRAPYDEGKRFGEALAVAYMDQYDLDIRTVRIFNTYGPRMRPNDGRVIPNFISQALLGRDLTVHGDGSQTRSFCFVSDLVRGVRCLAGVQGGSGDVVNLGSTKEITINELATMVQSLIDTPSEITHTDRPTDDPELRCPDIERANQRLGWQPEIDLEEGLERTVKYFKEETSDLNPEVRK